MIPHLINKKICNFVYKKGKEWGGIEALQKKALLEICTKNIFIVDANIR